MLSEWTVECGHEDPVLVVPWSDPADPSRRFIDLRATPDELDWLEEPSQYPALLHALRALNAARSPVFTAKCDVWTLPAEELESLRFELDLIPEDSATGLASYIDLVWRERSIFVSLPQHEQLLHRMQRLSTPLSHAFATVECVLRPALIDLAVPQEGYAISLYVKAVGFNLEAAEQHWAAALTEVSTLLRGRAFSTS